MDKDQYELIQKLENKFKTVMIGAISRIENEFGYLWNHGDEPLNSTQELFDQKWEKLRLELLNHGNHHIRSAIKDLNRFFYEQKYKFRTIFKQPDNEGE